MNKLKKGFKNTYEKINFRIIQGCNKLYYDETGAFGIKEIAMTLAVIMIIGFVVTAVQGNMPTWVTAIWNRFNDMLDKLTA